MFTTKITPSKAAQTTFSIMRAGQLGRVVESVGTAYQPHAGEIVMRVWSRIVSLSIPGRSWGEAQLPHVQVELLPEGTTLTITAGRHNV